MRIGTNLAGIAQWSPQDPFIDYFKSARNWIPQKGDEWDSPEGCVLDLDEHGWIKSLPADGNPYDKVTTLVVPYGKAAREGDYIVLYEGEGEISYGLGGEFMRSQSSPRRDVVRLVRPIGGAGEDRQPILIQITKTDPNDYIRNIRVIHEANMTPFNKEGRFREPFLKNINPYEVLRFMDWQNTNEQTKDEINWDDRADIDNATWIESGVPISTIIRLANRARKNPWICIPHLATDDYVYGLAKFLDKTLDPDLTAYIELGNETWNDSFPLTWKLREKGEEIAKANPTLGWDNSQVYNLYYTGYRTAEIARIVRSAMKKSKIVLATQSAWMGLEQFAEKGLNGCPIDVYAIAPYFGGSIGRQIEVCERWANHPKGVVSLLNRLQKTIQGLKKEVTHHRLVATRLGAELACYEGGQHLVTDPEQGSEAVTKLFHAANRHPLMGARYTEYLNLLATAGVDLFVNFTDCSRWDSSGAWGIRESWNGDISPKEKAIREFIQGRKAV